MYKYKRRFVPVFRDFPEGCGVFSGHNLNAIESLTQSKFKTGMVQAHRNLPGSSRTQEVSSSNPSETESSRIKRLDSSRDVAKDEPILDSNGSVKDHQENEVIGETEDKQNQVLECSVKKKRLSLHYSTMELGTDLMNTSKRVVVFGLAAKSKCLWRQPRNRGSEDGLDNSRDVTKEESILESSGSVKDHQEKEVIREIEDKQNQELECLTKVSSVKNLHYTTIEVGTDLVKTSKIVVVSGLAAKSKCPWSQPRNRGSRQEKRRWKL